MLVFEIMAMFVIKVLCFFAIYCDFCNGIVSILFGRWYILEMLVLFSSICL